MTKLKIKQFLFQASFIKTILTLDILYKKFSFLLTKRYNSKCAALVKIIIFENLKNNTSAIWQKDCKQVSLFLMTK